jgi:condensin complex subunit 3
VGAWVDVVGDGHRKDKGKANAEQNAGEKEKGSVVQDVVSLLELFDLAEGKVAEDALLSVFKSRVDIFDALEFGG